MPEAMPESVLMSPTRYAKAMPPSVRMLPIRYAQGDAEIGADVTDPMVGSALCSYKKNKPRSRPEVKKK